MLAGGIAGGIAQARPPAVPASAASPARSGLQADFDAANAAYEAGQCADAEPLFARLVADPRVKPGGLPAAMIAVHRGVCALRRSDTDSGEAMLRQGLPIVEAAGAPVVVDAQTGWMALAQLAVRRFDHDGAVAAFNHALALPGMGTQLNALAGLAMVTAFDGDGAALSTVDRALAALATERPASALHKQEGYLRAIRTRVLMNLGRFAEADKNADKALSLTGGLTSHISLSDVSLRSDAAEAALLNNRQDQARELLAFTGAGRIKQSPFALASTMEVPDCDDTIGLRASDNAVVEFSVGDNGAVIDAQTVFTRGNYATARAYADAVRHWAWQPERIVQIPPFYKALVRVELRCSKGGGRMPDVTAPFNRRILDWARAWIDVGQKAADSPFAVARMLRQRAVALETSGDRIGAGTVLLAALVVEPVVGPTVLADADHAEALLAQSDVPHRASAAAMRTIARLDNTRLKAQLSGRPSPDMDVVLSDAAQDPAIAADALAQSTLLMQSANIHLYRRFSDRQIAVLRRIADDPRLEPTSPLRQIALLRLASRAASQGQQAEAEALFAQAGLHEEQCALIGDIPRMRDSTSGNDFPSDALRFGFEGWVREEYDIDANGHTSEPRAVIAYPPFVFVAGATAIARNFRYDSSFRPSGKLACAAKTETIQFILPSNR